MRSIAQATYATTDRPPSPILETKINQRGPADTESAAGDRPYHSRDGSTGSATIHSPRTQQATSITLVELRDGRSFTGILRSYDHFGNLLIDTAIERVRSPYLKNQFAELYVGTVLFRGENVSIFGSMTKPTVEEYLEKVISNHTEMQPAQEEEQNMTDEEVPYKVSLAKIYTSKMEATQRHAKAESIWTEYNQRLESLGEGETLQSQFFKDLTQRAIEGGIGQDVLTTEMMHQLFEQYVRIGANAYEIVKRRKAEQLIDDWC